MKGFKQGIVISFEGPAASGKTVGMRDLSDKLELLGYEVFRIHSPLIQEQTIEKIILPMKNEKRGFILADCLNQSGDNHYISGYNIQLLPDIVIRTAPVKNDPSVLLLDEQHGPDYEDVSDTIIEFLREMSSDGSS